MSHFNAETVLVHLDVEYPDFATEANVPDVWLPLAVVEFRKNLERAVLLEEELGGYGLNLGESLIPDEEENEDQIERRHGLTGGVTAFADQFARLVDVDRDIARHEFSSWKTSDDAAFSRLKIWACGNAKLATSEIVCSTILSLGDDAFWNTQHQRDLLLVLAKRWAELTGEARIEIERRLLNGRPQWEGEDDGEFDERQARLSLDRITWLANNGCSFAINLDAETEKLRSRTPEWKPSHADLAVRSNRVRSGWVQTATEHTVLLDEPLASTLAKALELSGRVEDHFVERDPFAGLATERPIRAFAALSIVAKRGEYPEWAWHTFLNRQSRKEDAPRFSALIAERLSSYPRAAISDLIRPASDWLLIVSKNLASAYPASFEKVTKRLIEVLELESTESGTTIVRTGNEPDWATEALNAPAGKIAQALCEDPRKNDLKPGQRFPMAWLAHVDRLLALPGDARRHAIVIFAFNLNWLFIIDPTWTETNLISFLDGDDEDDASALWSGFLWGAMLPRQTLYMRMKPSLLDFAKNRSFVRRGHHEVLAGIILAGWANRCDEDGKRYISSAEMRDVILEADDELRSRILWQMQQWAKEDKGDASLDWSILLPEFLRHVWPRHKSAKSPAISARLCNLVLASNDSFPEMVQIVLPLVTVIDRDLLWLPDTKQTENNVASRYPEETLTLLHKVLPGNARSWPYGTGPILERIGDARDDLKRDERLIELKRRWNSR